MIDSSSQVTSEIRVLPADAPSITETTVLWARRQDIEAAVEPAGDVVYFITNEDAPNFRLLEAPRATVHDRSTWTERLPADPEVYLEGIDAFVDHLVAWERHAGLRRMRVLSRADRTAPPRLIPLPDPVYAVWPGANPLYEVSALRYGYSSPTRPSSVYTYDLAHVGCYDQRRPTVARAEIEYALSFGMRREEIVERFTPSPPVSTVPRVDRLVDDRQRATRL